SGSPSSFSPTASGSCSWTAMSTRTHATSLRSSRRRISSGSRPLGVHRRDPATVPIDRSIAGGDGRSYQIDCIETLTREVALGRRKLLVEMATGTGKTRMAAAFIKRLFEAGIVTRALFLVDRVELAKQAEDA